MPVLKRTFAYAKRTVRFAPNFGHDGALAAITKADTILEKAHDRKWVVSG
jgi:hypothetical protein